MPPVRLGRRVIIPGPVLIGFADMFDASYGDPRTPRPYPKVTPSKIGQVLLPFACPHCDQVRSIAVDPKKYDYYRDTQRGFSWCPACRGRYVVNYKGALLDAPLPIGAASAPAIVERGKSTTVVGAKVESGLHLLGAT